MPEKIEINDEMAGELRACIAGKKSSSKCMDKVLEKYGIDPEQKAEVLTQVIKKMDSEAKEQHE